MAIGTASMAALEAWATVRRGRPRRSNIDSATWGASSAPGGGEGGVCLPAGARCRAEPVVLAVQDTTTLKSGCRIEERQLGHADSLEACLGVDLVVAWRVLLLAHQGREHPDAPASV